MRRTVTAAILVLVVLVTAQPASAQTVLERLEQQIHRRLEQPTSNGSTSKSSTTPSVLEVVDPVTPPNTVPLEESGYAGLLADDARGTGRGVRILEVRSGGPADKGGLKQSDLVVGVDGKRIGRMDDLAATLSAYPPGRQTTFEVQRNDQRLQFHVVLGHRDRLDDGLVAEAPDATPFNATPSNAALSDVLADGGPAVTPANAPADAEPPKGPALVFRETPPPQDDDSGNWQAELEMLRRRVEQLEQRVIELEKASSSPAEGG